MNATDIALLVVGSFFVIRGIFKGLSGGIFSLLGVMGGFYCSLTFYSPAAAFLSRQFGLSTLASSAITMLVIFLLIFSVCAFFEKFAKKILATTNLTWLDKLGGALAGFVVVYLVSLVLLVAGMLLSPITGDAWVCESKALVATAKTWPFVYPLLDKAGVLPDLSELQAEAKTYIIKQASQSLFEPLSMDATAISADAMPDIGATLESGGLLDFFLNWSKEQ